MEIMLLLVTWLQDLSTTLKQVTVSYFVLMKRCPLNMSFYAYIIIVLMLKLLKECRMGKQNASGHC